LTGSEGGEGLIDNEFSNRKQAKMSADIHRAEIIHHANGRLIGVIWSSE